MINKMNKKKIFSILMSTALIFGAAAPSFAAEINIKNTSKIVQVNDKKEVIISKGKAEEIAINALKTYFNLDVKAEKLKNTSDTEPSSYDGNSFWSMNWEDQAKGIYVSVYMDAKTGKILNIANNSDTSTIDEESEVKISAKDAEKIANEFLKKINSNDLKECAEAEANTNWKNYSVKYVRKVNGIKVPSESIDVVVDGVSKRIVSYNVFFSNNIKFPENKNTIDINKAEEKLRKEVKLEPVYREKYVQDKNGVYNPVIELVYVQSFNGSGYIDAFTGETIKYEDYQETNEKLDLDKKEKESIYKKYKENTNKPLTDKKEAENIIKEHIKDLYGSKYKLEEVAYDEESKMWAGHFYNEKDGKRDYEGDITIKQSTREISYVGAYSNEEQPSTNVKFKLNSKEAYKKALDAVVKYYPSKIKNIITEHEVYAADIEEHMTFNFDRAENGIPFAGNNISVTVNTVTGEIETLGMYWNEGVQLPSSKNMISKDKALDNFFKKYKPELIYIIDGYEANAKGRLIYIINGNNDIDAITGETVLKEEIRRG
jgi:hypothetical protein